MTKKKSKAPLMVIISLLIIGLATAGFMVMNSREEEVTAPKEREYTATRGDITVGIDGDGKLTAENNSYTANVDIEIKNILVNVGEKVTAGQNLFELSVSESEKNYKSYKEEYDKIKEKLDDVKEDRHDYLMSLNWLLENQKDDSYNRYINKYWEIKNEIYRLEDELSEAEYKKSWTEQQELIDLSIGEITTALEKKKAELQELEDGREKEKELEGDYTYQKEQQEQKIAEYDADIAAVEAQLKDIESKMNKAKSRFITADKDGVIQKINYKAGDKVKSESPVVEIGDTSKMTLKLNISPESVVDIEKEQVVQFYVDAFPEKSFTGTVDFVNLVPNSEGNYEVFITVDETDSQLLDGMAAAATVIIKQKKDILTLQNKAIFMENGKEYVKIKNAEGINENHEISTGFSDGRTSEILSGLEEGQVVVLEEA